MHSSRYFFALWPNPIVARQLAGLQTHLPPHARLLHCADFHLTLAFLGELPVSAEPTLLDILDTVPFSGVELVIDRIDVFQRIGVTWAGPSTIPRALQNLYGDLSVLLDERQIWFDRYHGFQPHLTLARKTRMTPYSLKAPVMWWADRLVLACSGIHANDQVPSSEPMPRYRVIAQRGVHVARS